MLLSLSSMSRDVVSLNISGMELHNDTNNCWKLLGALCERSDENQSP